jgi:hypothetical protein
VPSRIYESYLWLFELYWNEGCSSSRKVSKWISISDLLRNEAYQLLIRVVYHQFYSNYTGSYVKQHFLLPSSDIAWRNTLLDYAKQAYKEYISTQLFQSVRLHNIPCVSVRSVPFCTNPWQSWCICLLYSTQFRYIPFHSGIDPVRFVVFRASWVFRVLDLTTFTQLAVI